MGGSSGEAVFDVAQADFERLVIEGSRDKPVVVDFWAPWCGPCRMLGPVLERLVGERGGEVHLARVNIDEAQDLAARYRVESIPLVVAFRGGEPVLEFLGLQPEEAIRAFLDRISPTEADRLARRAEQVEKQQPREAEALYRRALEQDPRHEAAAVGLARLLVEARRDEEARDLLGRNRSGAEHEAEAERLTAVLQLREQARELPDVGSARARLQKEPASADARYELGAALAAAGDYRGALETLLSAAEADPKLARSKVRETMVQVFQAVGVRSPLADEFRDKLSRLLY